jgi:hypothetical protein
MNQIGPRGWRPGQIEKRFANTAPSSYSAENRTVDAVISMGSPVRRFYGIEKLRIAPDAIIVDRLIGSGIPVLDSHMQASISSALGKLTRVWFPNDGTLMGKLAFHATTEGRVAERSPESAPGTASRNGKLPTRTAISLTQTRHAGTTT